MQDGVLRYADGDHLSIAGSRLLSVLFAKVLDQQAPTVEPPGGS
jgi:hypothetical protein